MDSSITISQEVTLDKHPLAVGDLVLETSAYLSRRKDVLNLSQCTRTSRDTLRPVLHRCVRVDMTQLLSFASMIKQDEAAASTCRSLQVRPDYELANGQSKNQIFNR